VETTGLTASSNTTCKLGVFIFYCRVKWINGSHMWEVHYLLLNRRRRQGHIGLRAEHSSEGVRSGRDGGGGGRDCWCRNILTKRALVDWTTVVIALISFGALLGFRKLPEPVLIGGAGIAGIVLHHSS
jgi:hypothetical protein